MSDDSCTCDAPQDSAGTHHRDWCGQPITGPEALWEAMYVRHSDDPFYDDFDKDAR